MSSKIRTLRIPVRKSPRQNEKPAQRSARTAPVSLGLPGSGRCGRHPAPRVPGCCWEQGDEPSLAGCWLVTAGRSAGRQPNVPEDGDTAVPSPSKAEPWWEGWGGSSRLWARMTALSI